MKYEMERQTQAEICVMITGNISKSIREDCSSSEKNKKQI